MRLLGKTNIRVKSSERTIKRYMRNEIEKSHTTFG